MSVRLTILQEIESIAADQHKMLAPLKDDLFLIESGLDSLCIAILVSHLEDKLGVDPFASVGASHFPTTLGELVSLYEGAEV